MSHRELTLAEEIHDVIGELRRRAMVYESDMHWFDRLLPDGVIAYLESQGLAVQRYDETPDHPRKVYTLVSWRSS